MRHPDEGQLRAYADGALAEEASERVRRHLAACPHCAREEAAVQARGVRVGGWLAGLDPQGGRQPLPPAAARQHLESHRGKERRSMLRELFGRRYRAGWAVAVLALLVGVAFSFAPVRALAGDLLALFRVRRLEFVQVDNWQLPHGQALDAAARKLEALMHDRLSLRRDGEARAVDEATARSRAGFAVRLPTTPGDSAQLTLQPQVHATMDVDLPRIRALLSELGYDSAALPDSLDGTEVGILFHPMLVASYGRCGPANAQQDGVQGPAGAGVGCTVLVQMPSPEVSVPPELALDQLGRAYLQVLGMNADEAARFSQRVDWTTTLVVPIPGSRNLDCRDVRVDGVDGMLLRSPQSSGGRQQYVLVWVKDGIVYALNGVGTVDDALRIAGSLR